MSHNTAIHRIVRPIVRVAARTHVTPNQVTTMRLISGLTAAVIFAAGTYWWMFLGGLVFLLSMLLDRADGELARQTNQMSPAGYRYDLISDCVVSITTFVGIGIGVAQTMGSSALWFGVLAGLGIGALFFELNVLKVASVSGHEFFGGRIIIDPDDAMILVPILIWCGLAYPLVAAAAVTTPLAAVGVGVLAYRRRYTRSPKANGELDRGEKARR
ncbi:MAG: CDP-alcohol phosphatidyltransferase family protein [Janthinobacterium lividum]